MRYVMAVKAHRGIDWPVGPREPDPARKVKGDKYTFKASKNALSKIKNSACMSVKSNLNWLEGLQLPVWVHVSQII